MLLASILSLLLGCVIAALGAVYCFKPDMIVRQANDVTNRRPRLLHFALPIRPRDGSITARQVRSTGLGLLLLSAWFLLAAFVGILGHH
jgi:predicted lysophospholipase L1 biosynthesis ABC-type transport system permease subunit